jgi:hypothetical protein
MADPAKTAESADQISARRSENLSDAGVSVGSESGDRFDKNSVLKSGFLAGKSGFWGG